MAAAELWCKYELSYAFSKNFGSYLHFQIEPTLSDINRSYNKRNEALRDSLLSSVLVLWPIMQNGFLT